MAYAHDNQMVTLTIQWLSQESDPLTLSHDPQHGWYRLKQRLVASMSHPERCPVRNPLHIAVFRLQGDDLMECGTHAIVEGIYYATVRPPLQERLDYIYPMGGDDLWRWTYKTQEGASATISFIVRDGQFCPIQAFYRAKREGLPVLWYQNVDVFVSQIGLEMEKDVRFNLSALWHQRRQ